MTITPAMQQYYDIKEEYSDAIVFFRMGDFYEMFDEDAHIAHSVLGIALTTRNKNATTPTPLAGIPYHAKEKYLKTLIDAGYKVAITEQISDPKLKGIVERAVVRVVTPATLSLESESYDSSESQVLLSIVELKGKYGLGICDMASHEFSCSEFSDKQELVSRLYILNPKEVILEKNLFSDSELKEVLEKKFQLHISFVTLVDDPEKKLLKHFGVQSLSSFGIEKYFAAQKAASLLLTYIESNQKTQINFLSQIFYESFSQYMGLDESTLKSLDILYNFAIGSSKEGTLYSILDRMKTSVGKRKLRYELTHPLQDIKKIEQRHDFIEAFLSDSIILEKVEKELKNISDIDGILNRISLDRATLRDMLLLKKSLQAFQSIEDIILASENKVLKRMFL